MYFETLPEKDEIFPFWIERPYLVKINKLMKKHLSDVDESYKYGLANMSLSEGVFENGSVNNRQWKGLAKIKVGNNKFICSKVELSLKSFGLNEEDAYHITKISTYITGMSISELYSNLKDFLDGNENRVASAESVERIIKKWKEDGFRIIAGQNMS